MTQASVQVNVQVTSSTPATVSNTSVVGIAGIVKKPLADFSVIKVKSMDEAKAKLGSYMVESTVMYGLDKLFKKLGQIDIYVSPVTHRTDVTNANTEIGKPASVIMKDSGGTNSLIEVDCNYLGTDGNKYAIRISNVSATAHTYDVEILYGGVVVGKKIVGVTNTTFLNRVVNADLRFTQLVNVDTNVPNATTFTLAGGVDAHTGVVAGDYDTAIGRLFDKPLDFIFVDSTLLSNEQTAISLAEQINAVAFVNTPYGTDDDGALAHRTNFNSAFGQLFHPHQWELDPIGSKNKPNRAIPIAYEAIADYVLAHREIGRRQVGAGVIYGSLTGLGLTASPDGDTLSDNGINYALSFENDGTYIWDAMTLSNDPEWESANRVHLFNYVTKIISPLLRPDLFSVSDQDQWQSITTRLTMPMSVLYKAGEFYSEDGTEKGAYYVQCDGTNNPRDVQLSGQTKVKVGYNDKATTKWIELDIEIA